MANSLGDLPIIPDPDQNTGDLPSVLAAHAQALGLLFRSTVAVGPAAGRDILYMVGPDANRFVLHTHRAAFSHKLGWDQVFGKMLGQGLLNMDDPDHATQRKLWNPAFTTTAMEHYLPIIQDLVTAHTARWTGIVDVYAAARALTFDIAATTLAGIPPGPRIDRLRELFYTLVGGTIDALRNYDLYLQRALPARAELIETLLGIIATRRTWSADPPPQDVLGLIVQMASATGMSDGQILGHLNILLVAGHETTTMLAAWVLYYLARLPEQQQQVITELDTVLGGAPPTVAALRRLKVLDNFIREAGRLHAPILVVPRVTTHSLEFGGYTIPPSTQICLALAATHRLPTIFANPDHFDPTRFLPPRAEDQQTPYSLVTFGGGPRICLGVNFATVEVKVLVAQVLRTLHLDLAVANMPPPRQTGFFATLVPDGIFLRISPRT